jgi:hypothetical protein
MHITNSCVHENLWAMDLVHVVKLRPFVQADQVGGQKIILGVPSRVGAIAMNLVDVILQKGDLFLQAAQARIGQFALT